MGCQVTDYQIGVRNIFFGTAKPQKSCILTKADVAASLNNKFFIIHQPNLANTKHVFWYDVASGGTAPTGLGTVTLHEINISTGATAGDVATATNAVINALSWVNSVVSLTDATHIEVTMVDNGATYWARDAEETANQTGFTFVNVQKGRVRINLGVTNGDTVLTKEIDQLAITSPQTGAYVLSNINRGMTGSATFELKDTSQASFVRLFEMDGSAFVTDDADSKVIAGYGQSNLFKSSDVVADTLTLADPTGNTNNDIHLMKAKLTLGELTFSGESELVLPVTAEGYLDQTINPMVNFIAFGDLSKLKTV